MSSSPCSTFQWTRTCLSETAKYVTTDLRSVKKYIETWEWWECLHRLLLRNFRADEIHYCYRWCQCYAEIWSTDRCRTYAVLNEIHGCMEKSDKDSNHRFSNSEEFNTELSKRCWKERHVQEFSLAV